MQRYLPTEAIVLSFSLKRKSTKRMKERITLTLDKELLEWLDKKIEDKIFANRSHGFEFLIMEMLKKEENGQKKNSW